MARPGAFAANFAPDTLNRFRDLCKAQGRQYTKVLELLALLYLDTNGAVLDSPCVPSEGSELKKTTGTPDSAVLKDLVKRVEELESSNKEQVQLVRTLSIKIAEFNQSKK